MSENTNIEWADHTFNPWIGCTKVSPGCDNCYAKADFEDRKHRVVWGAGQARSRTKTWGDPVRWNKQHAAFFAEHGRRQRVFCASLADVFDNEVLENWRIDLFTMIEETPNLDWLLLTKRIGNTARLLPWSACSEPWPNVWLGATIVNQEEADRDIPKLLEAPAAKRFLSIEPLLGPVDLTNIWTRKTDPIVHSGAVSFAHRLNAIQGMDGFKLDWVIVGGESGPNARPMHPEWAASLRDQCQKAGVSFIFKQWGEWLPALQATRAQRDAAMMSDQEYVRLDGSTHTTSRDDHELYSASDCLTLKAGKKAAGRLLDGREWNGVPS